MSSRRKIVFMTEEERRLFNALGVEVQIQRVLLLDLLRTVHGNKVVERASTLLADAIPVPASGDPEAVEKIQTFKLLVDRLLADLGEKAGD